MSCRDIGCGMGSVGREVLRLYDEGKYDVVTAGSVYESISCFIAEKMRGSWSDLLRKHICCWIRR